MDLTSPLFFSGVLRLGTAIVLYFTPAFAKFLFKLPFAEALYSVADVTSSDLTAVYKSRFYLLVLVSVLASTGAMTIHMSGSRGRHNLVAMVLASITSLALILHHYWASGSHALLPVAALDAVFGIWALGVVQLRDAESYEPLHILSPLFWAGIVQGVTGALIHVAPAKAWEIWLPALNAVGLTAHTFEKFDALPASGHTLLAIALCGSGAYAVHLASSPGAGHSHSLIGLVCGSATAAMFSVYELTARGHNGALLFVLLYGTLALWAYTVAQRTSNEKAKVQ